MAFYLHAKQDGFRVRRHLRIPPNSRIDYSPETKTLTIWDAERRHLIAVLPGIAWAFTNDNPKGF